MDWTAYFKNYFMGIKIYLTKENLDSTNKSKYKLFW